MLISLSNWSKVWHALNTMIRSFVRYSSTVKAFVAKCPAPKIDTGCTHCLTDAILKDLPPIHEPPFDISNTLPPMVKMVVYLSGNGNHDVWPKKFESIEGSVMNVLGRVKRGSGIGLLYSSLAGSSDNDNEFLIYPKGIKVRLDDCSSDSLTDFFEKVKENRETELDHEVVHDPVVLICSHTQRDIRCGVIGPLVEAEFNKVVKDNVRVGLVSHVGGHVYAGNVLIARPGHVDWYGMVKPQFVQGLVDVAIEKNSIIQPLFRGRL